MFVSSLVASNPDMVLVLDPLVREKVSCPLTQRIQCDHGSPSSEVIPSYRERSDSGESNDSSSHQRKRLNSSASDRSHDSLSPAEPPLRDQSSRSGPAGEEVRAAMNSEALQMDQDLKKLDNGVETTHFQSTAGSQACKLNETSTRAEDISGQKVSRKERSLMGTLALFVPPGGTICLCLRLSCFISVNPSTTCSDVPQFHNNVQMWLRENHCWCLAKNPYYYWSYLGLLGLIIYVAFWRVYAITILVWLTIKRSKKSHRLTFTWAILYLETRI